MSTSCSSHGLVDRTSVLPIGNSGIKSLVNPLYCYITLIRNVKYLYTKLGYTQVKVAHW